MLLKFKPVFEGSFDLFCPKLDESMERKWLRAKNLPKLKDFQEAMLKSIQYQMMDSMRPMLHAWNQMIVDDPLLNSIESSLRLIGSAFANVSKLRRENVIRHVAPSMKPLLKDPRAFSSRECERLFGSKFIDVMVKEVDDDAKLAKIGRDGGPSHSHNGGNSNRRNGGRSQSSYGSRTPYVQNSGFNRGGKSDKGNHYFKQPAQGANNRYVNLSDCFTPPIFTKTPPVQPHIGGRLSKFSEAWLSLTDDQWILSTVSHGYAIDFVKHPIQHSVPSGCTMSKEMELVCDQEVKTLMTKGVIRPVHSNSNDGFISNMFAIPKKSGGWRPIINLKCLNAFVSYQHFKMEGLECVKYLLQHGDWMVKLDLQDAYFLVPISPEHYKFLRFFWKGNLYEYLCLAFGLCSVPRVFTKLLKPVVAYLRERGIRIIIYLHDMLILNASRDGILADLKIIIGLLKSLGFIINFKKSIVVPQQIIEYLGMLINSLCLSFSLPQNKVESIVKLCNEIMSDKVGRVKLRDLAKIMGNFSWAIPSVPFAQGHFRKLQNFYLSHAHRDLNKMVSLTEPAKADLVWWATHLKLCNGKSFFPDNPDLIPPLPAGVQFVMALGLEDLGLLPMQNGTSTN